MNDKLITACPNPSCEKGQQDFIEKISKVLFGQDEQSGLLGRLRKIELCVGKKVSRGVLVGTAITVVGVLVVVFVPMITGAISTMGKINERTIIFAEQVKTNKEKITATGQNHRDYINSAAEALQQERIIHNAEHDEFETRYIRKSMTMKEELTTLLMQSEQRIKEHIDLAIRAHDKTNSTRPSTGTGTGTGP